MRTLKAERLMRRIKRILFVGAVVVAGVLIGYVHSIANNPVKVGDTGIGVPRLIQAQQCQDDAGEMVYDPFTYLWACETGVTP